MTFRPCCLAALALFACACSSFRRGPFGDDTGVPSDADDVVMPADAPPDVPIGGCGSGPGACNVLTQGGCAADQACALISGSNDAGVTSICELPGGGGFGATCASPDACQTGLHCIAGQCHPICCASGGTCSGPGVPSNARCGFDFGASAFGVALCTVPCDWNSQNCPNALTCLPIAANGTSDCFASGSAGPGSMCQQQSDCARGLVCALSSGSASGTCRAICDPTSPSPNCASFQSCVHVDMTPATFGACV